jgi:acetyl-CoA carboxylase biotin carboxyl carrier protein
MAKLEAPVTGSVWKIETTVGAEIAEGDVVLILESMKMEIPLEAEADGRVVEITCTEGDPVAEGHVLVVTEP